MLQKTTTFVLKFSLILGLVPFAAFAYPEGPPAFRTGAPGDQGTCLGSGCHSGSLNPAAGSVKIVLPGANTYTPGVKQHLMVQIVDSTKQKFGFELTARPASNITGGQAGNFTSSDQLTQVICADESSQPCAAKFAQQFVEHTFAGYSASTTGGYTYQFDWTPPATDVGNVNLYVSSVAGPGGAANQNNANVYTASLTLTPAAAPANAPVIPPGGVVPVYSTSTTVQPGSWFSVYGSNLAAATTIWNGDFPTNLGGTTVKVNNKPAYLWFVSAGQINAQAPDDTATGTVPVSVTTANGTANTTITLAPASPSFLLLGDAKHVTGIILTPDGSGSQAGGVYDLLGPAATGAGFRPAKKGDNVALYGVGFGPLLSPVPAGKVYASASGVVTLPTVTLGGVPVTVDFAGVVGAGLYQLNFKIPQNAPSGELVLAATSNGLQTQSGILISVQ